jgi:PAS domain S-box-containing protein
MTAGNTREPAMPRRKGRESGDDLRWLFRQLPGAAWITDRNLRIVEIIGYVERNLGRSQDSLIGRPVMDIAQTRDPSDPAIAAHVAALAGKSSSFRYRLGTTWYEVHVEQVRDEAGQIVGCIGAAVNITNRVELEQRAAASEARAAEHQRRSISLLEATIESTEDGILVVNRAGKVVAFNKRFCTLWRIPSEMAIRGNDTELLAFVLGQLIHPDRFLARVHELYAEPTREDLDVLEFKDGRVFERYSRPQNVDGKIVGRVWSFRDVTVRTRLLRHAVTLADASRLLGSLDAIAALESVARLLVRTWDACVFDLFEDSVLRRRVVVERDPTIGVVPAISTETHAMARLVGERTQLQVPLRAGARVVGRLTVIGSPGQPQDEQELELLEEIARRCAVAVENARLYRDAREQVHAREEFLAVASHEIRGPIASIRLAVEGLRTAVAPTEQLVEIIDREERRLERLVDELLDLGLLQSRKLHLVFEPVDLAEVVREVVTRHAAELARVGSRLTIQGEPVLVGRWDRTRLEQVVANLLSNAIKFGGGKPIEVEIARTDERAVLSVTDHGIGIPEHKLTTIFEPFERAVPSRHYGGLGLGLYIVRAIVTRLGGRIDVRSTPDAGATFVVEVPREVSE